MSELSNALPITLQRARKARRLSQLELSMRVGVSQRHVSFVENGRAKPSRELLMSWLHELDSSLAFRNAALLQAGYAPAYGNAGLSDPALAQANEALARLLQTHDPMPALVIDSEWNVLNLNRGARWLAATLMPWTAGQAVTRALNILDLLVHPDGFTRCMVNLREVGPAFLGQLRNQLATQPALEPKVEAFEELLKTRLGMQNIHSGGTLPVAPVLTSRYATEHGELAFFSMFSTFGMPQDITLASLRVEHMFAADQATHAVLEAKVPR
jgi:transcriptional regulator with XRE-family HTH domain